MKNHWQKRKRQQPLNPTSFIMLRTILKTGFFLLLLVVLYLCVFPVSIEPVSFTPHPNPDFQGPFEVNNALTHTSMIIADIEVGPEDIAIGPDNLLYTSTSNGDIIRFSLDGQLKEVFGNAGGRPLDLQ